MSLKITTFSSKGRATRIYGYNTKRIHHLQSDNQLRLFLMLEWHDKVKDIKENIELKGIEATVNNVEEHIAISVKSLSELERRTVIEKLKIERRYWMGKGVKFYVITEK